MVTLRRFLKDWVLPPKIGEGLANWVAGSAPAQLDPRRWWNGELLPAPSANVPLFRGQSGAVSTVTFQEESRCCLEVAANETVELNLASDADGTCVVSVGCGGVPSIRETVEFRLNGTLLGEFRYLAPKQWHDLRFDVTAASNGFSVRNNTQSTLYLCHPCMQRRVTPSPSARARNVVMLVLDALTRDAIDLSSEGVRTPNLARFFSRGAVFSQAFAQSEWTLPSLYSLMTARYPIDHMMVDPNCGVENLPGSGGGTFPETLSAMGFSTLAYSTAKVFHPAYNAHLGFDRFFYSPYMSSGLTYDRITKQAIVQLETNRHGRNFLFLHYIDSHEPWTYRNELSDALLPRFRITDPSAEYAFYKEGEGDSKVEPIFSDEGIDVLDRRRDARLRELDLALESLFHYLESTGQVDETLVVFCSDHGSSYPNQGRPLLFNDKVHVPLMIRGPHVPATQDDSLIALNLDLVPTLLELLGVPSAPGDGRVVPPLGGQPRTMVISESLYRSNYQIAVRDDEFVYHVRCGFDPQERRVDPVRQRRCALYRRSEERESRDLMHSRPDVALRFEEIVQMHLEQFKHRVVSAGVEV